MGIYKKYRYLPEFRNYNNTIIYAVATPFEISKFMGIYKKIRNLPEFRNYNNTMIYAVPPPFGISKLEGDPADPIPLKDGITSARTTLTATSASLEFSKATALSIREST